MYWHFTRSIALSYEFAKMQNYCAIFRNPYTYNYLIFLVLEITYYTRACSDRHFQARQNQFAPLTCKFLLHPKKKLPRHLGIVFYTRACVEETQYTYGGATPALSDDSLGRLYRVFMLYRTLLLRFFFPFIRTDTYIQAASVRGILESLAYFPSKFDNT